MLDPNFGLPEQAILAANDYLGSHYYSKYPTLAFLINRLNGNQLAYHLINMVNRAVRENPYLSIGIYVLEQEPVIAKVNTAVYNVSEIRDYHGPLVYCDYPSFDFGSKFIKNSAYFLMYDPWLLLNMLGQFDQKRISYLQNYSKRIFVRGTDYDKLMKTRIGVDTKVIPSNFEIQDLVKEIYGPTKKD